MRGYERRPRPCPQKLSRPDLIASMRLVFPSRPLVYIVGISRFELSSSLALGLSPASAVHLLRSDYAVRPTHQYVGTVPVPYTPLRVYLEQIAPSRAWMRGTGIELIPAHWKRVGKSGSTASLEMSLSKDLVEGGRVYHLEDRQRKHHYGMACRATVQECSPSPANPFELQLLLRFDLLSPLPCCACEQRFH